MQFSFNAVELCVVTINQKPWTRTRELCKALQYNKKSAHVSPENYAQKYQMSNVPAAVASINWPKDSRKDDYYTNEEGMYELFFSSQQLKTKDFRRHCCNVLFPHDKVHAMEIEDLTGRVQDLEFRKEAHQPKILRLNEEHQQAIGEKDAALALLNDDQQNRDNQIQANQYENVALQAQKDVYQAELQKCQDTITHLKTSYVPHARNPGKDNIIIIVQKHTTSANNKYHHLPYYVARIQRRKKYVKLRWFDQYFPDHEVIVEIDNPSSIHEFNRFEGEGHAE